MCQTCNKYTCIKCKKSAHKGMKCVRDEYGSGMNNIHRCPKCRTVFEKMSGCSEMSCSQCYHKWCWVCGMNYKSNVHMLLVFPCQLLNITVLHEKVPLWFRPLLLLLWFLLMPTLFLLLFFFFVPILMLSESKRSRHIFKCMFFYESTLQNIFIGIPAWLIFLCLVIAVDLILSTILIIPMYLVSIACFCRMIYWWNKNKSLNNS